jgi:hypothetical protein
MVDITLLDFVAEFVIMRFFRFQTWIVAVTFVVAFPAYADDVSSKTELHSHEALVKLETDIEKLKEQDKIARELIKNRSEGDRSRIEFDKLNTLAAPISQQVESLRSSTLSDADRTKLELDLVHLKDLNENLFYRIEPDRAQIMEQDRAASIPLSKPTQVDQFMQEKIQTINGVDSKANLIRPIRQH